MPRYNQTPLQLHFGQQLKQIRLKAGLTLQDASKLTGRPMATLSLVENGKQNITLIMMGDILTAYNYTFTLKPL